MKNNNGFTLIEILVVIVVLGLVVAIAIPSISNYINDSKDKAFINNIEKSINAVRNDVTVKRVVPRKYYLNASCVKNGERLSKTKEECILEGEKFEAGINDFLDKKLEKSPYGNLYSEESYVSVTKENGVNQYCFLLTDGFKKIESCENNLSNIEIKDANSIDSQKTLTLDLDGGVISDNNITYKLESGETITLNTPTKTNQAFVSWSVVNGNGSINGSVFTMGNSDTTIKANYSHTLSSKILIDNGGISSIVAKETPDFKVISETNEGMYSTPDNDGTSYYFRGAIDNNYIRFKNTEDIYRIVRINGDGSVRIVSQENVLGGQVFNTVNSDFIYMYYSNSSIKQNLESWYDSNTSINKSLVVPSMFCEQARVKDKSSYEDGNATMIVYSNYTPSLVCGTDGYNKGPLTLSVGMLTYDEVVMAGLYRGGNSNNYLCNNNLYWLMSPSGRNPVDVPVRSWLVGEHASVYESRLIFTDRGARAVLNIKGDALVSGSGIQSDPYII